MKGKIKYLLLLVVCAFCLFVASCTTVTAVTKIEECEEGVKITYSDGTTEVVPVVGQKGEQGDQGEQGIQGEEGPQGPAGENGQDGKPGEDGKDAAGIEFRYYRAQLWWRYEDTNVWYPLVSSEELKAESKSLANGDFTMSVYAEEYDLSFDITTFVEINGSWASGVVAGNTLTVQATIGEEVVFFDITNTDGAYSIVSYKEEGVEETPVEYVNNESIEAFVGTYTLTIGEESVVIAIDEYGSAKATIGEKTVNMQGFVKGNKFVAKQSYGGEASMSLEMAAMGPEFTTSFADAEGAYQEKTGWEVVVWVPASEMYGIYSMNLADGSSFDFQLKANNQLNLYDNNYPRYQYNVDTASFEVNGVTYSVSRDAEGKLVASASDGSECSITVWEDVISKLASFGTVEGEAEPIAWEINSYGGANKDGAYYASAVQQKNSVIMKPWSGNEYYVISFDSATQQFSGMRVVVEEGVATEYPISVVTEAKIEDFLGTYSITFEMNGNPMSQSFEIGPHPYREGEFAFIYMGNPNVYDFDGEARTVTYTNNRGGFGLMVTSNLDGSKSVVYFYVGDDNKPDPSTFIQCVVNFTPAE